MAKKGITGYFTDRSMNVLGLASTYLPGALKIEDDKETTVLEEGTSVFEATISYFSKKVNEQASDFVKVGNYFLFQTDEGEDKVFTIIDTEKSRKNNEIIFYAEDGSLDLINEVVPPFEATTDMTITKYFEKYLKDSGYQIGINELGDSYSRKLVWEGSATVTARLLSIATQFDHAEINFSFDIKGMTVTNKYVNIYKKRGISTGITLQLNREINDIISVESIKNLATALDVTGGTPEGKDEPITLKGYNYDDGRFFVDGIYLKDRTSNQIWNRPLADGTDNYTTKEYSYDTLSQKELCNRAITQLSRLSQKEQNFEVDITILPQNVKVGDRVQIVDQDDDLYLDSRILKIEQSRSLDESIATLGDHLIREDGFNERLKILAEQISKIKDGSTDFLWIRYADDADGNGFSANPTNKKFMALKHALNQPVPSDDVTDYAGLWVEIKGGDGLPGKPGEDGEPSYTWIRYADNVIGSGISSDPSGKKYVGFAYNKSTPTPSNVAIDYAWFLAKGDDGQDGKQVYFYTAYANSSNGVTDFTIDKAEAAGKKYFGTYSDTSNIQSVKPADYTWIELAGAFSEEIAKIKEEIDAVAVPLIQPETPASGLVNQQWWRTDIDGNVTGFFKWDGEIWQAQTIQQSALNIVELNAVKIKGAEITGSEISAGSFTTSFVNIPIPSVPQYMLKSPKASGTMTISMGKIRLNFYVSDPDGVDDYINSTGVIEVGVGGFLMRWTKADNRRNLAVLQIGLDGQYTSYTTHQGGEYIGGTMTPADLLVVPETGFTLEMYEPNFTQYDTTANNQPRYSRNNRLVQLSGSIWNKVAIPANTPTVKMATLPKHLRPSRRVLVRNQGSGMNSFLMYITTDGGIYMERYGTATSVQVPVGSWLNIAATYVAAD